MKKLLKYISLIIAILFVSTVCFSQGWIITDANNKVTMIGNGWIKDFPDDMDDVPMTTMYNSSKNLIIMINDMDMTYTKGSGDDFCNAMKSMRVEMNQHMPAEQQQMMKDMIAEQKAKPAPKVSVQKSSGESVAGYSTTKYSISVDGELYEEKWISNDASLSGLIQATNDLSGWGKKLAGCSVPDESFLKNAPEFSNEYMDVEHAGVEMKSVSYEFGSAEEGTDIVSIERENLSSEEFEVPGDYSQVSMKEMIMSMSGM